ncbi:MAG: hypothetical protein ACU85V_04465 [Gammaproteobacteria bacterium]
MKHTPTALILAGLLAAPQVFADWSALGADPSLWPYADGPTQQSPALPHPVYWMGSAVGIYQGSPAIFSVGGNATVDYSRDAPGSDPRYWGNRQSHFSIFRPDAGWISADGSDDTANGDGTWTSVGLTGYNNGNGGLSPTVDQGTGGVSDQAFVHGGSLYVFGGYPQWGGQMARYDIAANSWSQVARGDDAGLYGSGGGVVGDAWYKIRGDGALLRYDLATDTFDADVAVPGLLAPASPDASGVYGGAAGSWVVDGLLYVLDRAGSLQVIDPVAGTRSAGAAAPMAVSHAGTVAFEGRLYALGGRIDGDRTRPSDRIQIYDPGTDSWTFSTVRLPDARYGALAEVLGDTLYFGNGAVTDAAGVQQAIDDFWSAPMSAVATAVPLPPAGLLLGGALFALAGRLGRRR